MLYLAVIVLDFGVFVMMLTSVQKTYLILYLVVVYAFSGVVDILRAMEAKKYQAPTWKFSLISGILCVVVAIACIVFIHSTKVIMILFSAGLIYSAIVRIVTALRKTEMVYIP